MWLPTWMQIPILILRKPQRFLNHSLLAVFPRCEEGLTPLVSLVVSSVLFSFSKLIFFFCSLKVLVKTLICTGFHVGRRTISHLYTTSIPVVATYYCSEQGGRWTFLTPITDQVSSNCPNYVHRMINPKQHREQQMDR